MCKARNVFQMKYASCIPIEFKIMVALCILGRGCTADDIEELSGIGESTANFIFKTVGKEFRVLRIRVLRILSWSVLVFTPSLLFCCYTAS